MADSWRERSEASAFDGIELLGFMVGGLIDIFTYFSPKMGVAGSGLSTPGNS